MKTHVEPVTVVLTSCNRFDLLDRTLRSFAETNDYPISRFIVIEDSGLEGVRDIVARFPELMIEVIINRPGLGQYASIDRAYSLVETDFIFHCEDDWLFLRPRIIAESISLMNADQSIAIVWPRGDAGAPRWIKKTPRTNLAGVDIRPIDPRAHHKWGNFTFNPGLRRMSHYKKMAGGYVKSGEGGASIFLKRNGYRMVILVETGVAHIGGGGRSTANTLAIGVNPRAAVYKKLNKMRRVPKSLYLRVSHYIWLLSSYMRSHK